MPRSTHTNFVYRVIAGSILLFPIGLLFLLLQGGDVTLEGGSGLTATVVG